jgi:hypothetical protein
MAPKISPGKIAAILAVGSFIGFLGLAMALGWEEDEAGQRTRAVRASRTPVDEEAERTSGTGGSSCWSDVCVISTPRPQPNTGRARAELERFSLERGLMTPSPSPSQDEPRSLSLAIDVQTEGNTALSFGPIDDCAAIDREQYVQVDVVLAGIQEVVPETDPAFWPQGGLPLFIVPVEWNNDVLALVDASFEMLIVANPESSIFAEWDSLKNDGLYNAEALDLASHGLESGGGVLGRLTFRAIAPGRSEIAVRELLVQDAWEPYSVPDPRDATVVVGGVCS